MGSKSKWVTWSGLTVATGSFVVSYLLSNSTELHLSSKILAGVSLAGALIAAFGKALAEQSK